MNIPSIKQSSLSEIDIVCAIVLLDSDNRALLQLRDIKPGLNAAGLWVFPGGHKESEEDIWSCAKREFFEETNYHCEHSHWLMQIEDTFLNQTPKMLHIFWDFYDGNSSYVCQEGQALEFISRNKASDIAMPEYLVSIWDLVILASKRI